MNVPVHAKSATSVFALAALLALPPAVLADPKVPLAPGRYPFEHRFAEGGGLHAKVVVVIRSRQRIQVINTEAHPPFPKGVIAQGRLMWHGASQQWIIGETPADRQASEVGGCSEGPDVVDLGKRIYWTC